MLDHRHPAAGDRAFERFLADGFEIDFFVMLFGRVDDAAGVGVDAETASLLPVGALQLPVNATPPGRGRSVLDHMPYIDHITARCKTENLVHGHALAVPPLQDN